MKKTEPHQPVCENRNQIMIDQPVQGALLRHVSAYWFLCLFSSLFCSAVWTAFSDPNWTVLYWCQNTFPLLAPGLIGSICFLPLAWADVLRLSNRFVAPANSLRSAYRRLLANDRQPDLKTRKDDFWPDLISQFNQVRSRLQSKSAP